MRRSAIDNFSPTANHFAGGPIPWARRGLLVRGCVIVLGGIVLIFVGATYAFYLTVQRNKITDPIQAGALLQQKIPCTIPAGYACKQAISVPMQGGERNYFLIAPEHQQVASHENGSRYTVIYLFYIRDATKRTVWEMMRDEGTINDALEYQPEWFEVPIGSQKTTGLRTVRDRAGVAVQELAVPLGEDTVLHAMGPLQSFDQNAVAQFLVSLETLQPLPTEKILPAKKK